MLLNFIFILLSAALVSEVLPKNRTSGLWSLLLLSVVAYSGSHLFAEDSAMLQTVVYPWLQTPNLEINLNINLNTQNLPAVEGLWLLTFAALLGNWAYPGEKSPNGFNGLLLLNLVCMLLLVFAENYVQMLVALGICDVLVFGMINDFAAKRKYIYANFLADVGILSICAVIIGQSGNINIGQLSAYFEFGHHRDFVAILLLVCIFAKSGLFLFQGIYLDMAPLLLNRLSAILYITTPLAGFILLNKLHVLLNISHYTYPLLYLFSIVSVIWGSWGFLVMDNLKHKAVYLAMMFWGMVYYLTADGHPVLLNHFVFLLLSAYMLGQTLTLVNLASSNEVYVSEMGGFGKHIRLTFVLSALLLAAYFDMWSGLFDPHICEILGYCALVAMVFAHFCAEVYFGKSHADERVIALLKNPLPLFSVGLAAAAAAIFWLYPQNIGYVAVLMAIWSVFLLLRPLRRLNRLADNEWLQNSDYIDDLYDLLINTPIKIIGRVLWLMIDFVFIERTVISFLRSIFNFLIFVVRKLNANTWLINSLFILGGFAVMYAAWLEGGR